MAEAPVPALSSTVIGTAFGVTAALCWALGFTVAKYGIEHGMAPADLAMHRFAWTGLMLLPFLARQGVSKLGGVGWRRGLVMMLLAGPPQAFFAYLGFTMVPLGHGTVIQPATAAVAGVLLSAIVLHEHLTAIRIAGIAAIVIGLLIFGAEAVTSIGSHGVAGDLLFVLTGSMWAVFSVLLRRWAVSGVQAMMIVSVLALLVMAPLHGLFFGYGPMMAAGWSQNLLQAVVQGAFAGAIPIYLFARAVSMLGAGRASMFPALVPVFAVILGILIIGEIPTTMRLIGLAIVVIGFRFALKR